MTNLTKQEINKIYNVLVTNILKPIFIEHPKLSKEYFYDDGTFKPPTTIIYMGNNIPQITTDIYFKRDYPDIWLHIKPYLDQAQNDVYDLY